MPVRDIFLFLCKTDVEQARVSGTDALGKTMMHCTTRGEIMQPVISEKCLRAPPYAQLIIVLQSNWRPSDLAQPTLTLLLSALGKYVQQLCLPLKKIHNVERGPRKSIVRPAERKETEGVPVRGVMPDKSSVHWTCYIHSPIKHGLYSQVHERVLGFIRKHVAREQFLACGDVQ